MTGKLRRIFLGLGLASCLTFASSGAVFAQENTVETQTDGEEQMNTSPIMCDDEGISDQIQATLAYSSEGFLNTVMNYTEEELEEHIEIGSEFENAIASEWQEDKEKLGDFVSVQQHDISETNGIYTVVTTVQFENKNADLTVTYNADMQPINAVIDVEKTLGENMAEAGLNFILGFGIVFIVLIFLTFVIGLLKPLTEKIEGKKKEEPPQPALVAPVAPVEEEEDLADDLELVAVITAAIAASENTSSDGFVVRSIKRANNRKWHKI